MTFDPGLPRARAACYKDHWASIGACASLINSQRKSIPCLRGLFQGVIETTGLHRPKNHICMSWKGLTRTLLISPKGKYPPRVAPSFTGGDPDSALAPRWRLLCILRWLIPELHLRSLTKRMRKDLRALLLPLVRRHFISDLDKDMDVTTTKFLNVGIQILRSRRREVKHRVKCIMVSLKPYSTELEEISSWRTGGGWRDNTSESSHYLQTQQSVVWAGC